MKRPSAPYVGAVLLMLIGAADVARARDIARPALSIDHAWLRPAAAGGGDAGYLRIVNHGKTADWLVGATTPIAAGASLHESRMAGQVMTMRQVRALVIAPGSAVTLAPRGFHLMFEGLRRPVRLGQSVPVVLTFARAGRVTVRFVARTQYPAQPMPGM